ncbi:hypothetical protein PBNK65E_000031000 [Plasmodium berghei]|uniref:Uncharacterized protein n=1 Tax=Plasmodium berghei TaxID=5821 RepID=A0A0Y9TT11_PLABE|nr:hypothetical protein PBK173_000033000 [Plasmodium berghei]SCL90428.1 hypothetical protein PBNK65NY_000030700 [Plasmodium berghei]SCM15297.1 hypothetical protein PBSP11A_000030800 [Plasmodium berghei]SCM17092.1 hypothetical protein PBSP11RLL_000031000 [Plasmodium berghei]SCN22016.1 hypothetical protein PBNK65E_000031000 [Plasmodium berghei]
MIKNNKLGENATKLKNTLSKNMRPQLEQFGAFTKNAIDKNLSSLNEELKRKFTDSENEKEESKSNDQNEGETYDTSGNRIFGKVLEDITK